MNGLLKHTYVVNTILLMVTWT